MPFFEQHHALLTYMPSSIIRFFYSRKKWNKLLKNNFNLFHDEKKNRSPRVGEFETKKSTDLKLYGIFVSSLLQKDQIVDWWENDDFFSRADGSGLQIYLKREHFNHTGAHKIHNSLAQVLLAKHPRSTRITAEIGVGQHGGTTVTVGARFGLEYVVFMGAIHIERQKLNKIRMHLLGAEVPPATWRQSSSTFGTGTLTEALSGAIWD